MPVTSPTYRLSDEQYEQIQHLLPANGKRGGQWKDHRTMIDGILWALADGGRWRNLPEAFGPWQSVYDRFRSWTRRGLWDRILLRLQARKMRQGGSTGRCSASTAPWCAPTSRRPGRQKKSAGRRAGGPRPRS